MLMGPPARRACDRDASAGRTHSESPVSAPSTLLERHCPVPGCCNLVGATRCSSTSPMRCGHWARSARKCCLTASRPPPRSAPAVYWQSVANYRQTVLTAFQQAARRRPGHEPVADANRAGERFSLLPRQAQAARAEAHCIVVTGAAGPAPGRGEAITPSRVAQ
jgi:hypothetical protein